jgi:tight adherence protein B
MAIIQTAIIFVILLIVFGIIAFVFLKKEENKKNRSLALVTGQKSITRLDNQQDNQSKRRAEIAKKLKESKEESEGKKKIKKKTISLLLGQAGLSISVKQFWIYSVISMFCFLGFAVYMGFSPFVTVMFTIIGLLGVPKFVLKRITARRQKKFLSEFPDALEAMVRLLKAGMPVSEAISMISKEFDGPVGEEMTRVYDKQKIGVPLHEAALDATKRMPLTEMKMFATGLAIQAQTGSSLSEVLMNLAGVIRSRFKLKRKIKALSSEAVASASIIGALPILVALGLWFVNPKYIELLFTDPFGKILLSGAVIWMCLGIVVMKVMINFKI